MQTCKLQSLINIPGKANATLCASHAFVTLEAIIHDSSYSDGAIPASDQFGGSKADMPGYNCIAQRFEAWYVAHHTILRKTIEGYLDSVRSLTFNTIKTKLIMHAVHSPR